HSAAELDAAKARLDKKAAKKAAPAGVSSWSVGRLRRPQSPGSPVSAQRVRRHRLVR
ncbi:alpha-lytic protease prodomain-containing protein, partial [Streptomyces sp. NPDC005355]|uniref:alpha-lytic protease prodomain-containing protein n=1 Tax=Streptomyces sp. NPDC005355 TaxID=3157038 RepID=UPI0033A143C6